MLVCRFALRRVARRNKNSIYLQLAGQMGRPRFCSRYSMNQFEAKLAAEGLTLSRAGLQTLQINVGRKCNQACRHCHVDAGPWRTEMISKPVAHRVADWIRQYRPEIVDLTGGAPELSEFFRYFVETSQAAGAHVIDRCNLTIIEEPDYGDLPEY